MSHLHPHPHGGTVERKRFRFFVRGIRSMLSSHPSCFLSSHFTDRSHIISQQDNTILDTEILTNAVSEVVIPAAFMLCQCR